MRTALGLYVLALLARLWLVAGFPDPAYPDSFYYVDVARRLAAGQGLTIDVVWIFAEVGGAIPANPVLPIPSNAHWMPLASLVQVPFLLVLGPTALASALPFALAGAALAPLARAIARDAGARPGVALGAGVLAAVPGLAFPFQAQPDNFALFGPLAAGALWLGARALRGDGRALAGAGLLAGLATLSRNDGVLVLAAVLAAAAWAWRPRRGGPVPGPRPPLWSLAAAGVVFALVLAPWFARQLAVFGQLSPSAATGRVLFLRRIEDWNSIATPATLDWLLGMGAGPLLLTRVAGLAAALGIFAVLVGVVVLVPGMLAGAWARRRSPDLRPFLLYAAFLFAFSALVSAVHVPGGTFIHSAVALIPHGYLLALEGIGVLAGAVAARRRTWDAAVATRVFGTAAVAIAVLAGVAGTLTVHAQWAERRDRMRAVGAALDAAGAGPDDRLMSIDAAGYRHWTGRPGVVLVNDPLPTVEAVARAYAIRWLVLEPDESVPAMAPVIDGSVQPAWLGPALPVEGARAQLRAVCSEPGDARCAVP